MQITTFCSDNKDLPKLAVLCGVHGNESHAVSQVIDILNLFNNKDLELPKDATSEEVENRELVNNLLNKYSKISFCIGVNELGLEKDVREFINPDDAEEKVFDRDFNREFDFSKKYANILDAKREIMNLVKENDVIVDVHNSPMCENSVVFGLDDRLSSFIDISEKNKINYVVSGSLTNGVLKNYVNNNYSGKVALTVELQGMGIVNYYTRASSKDFLYRILNASRDYLGAKKEVVDNISIGIEVISPATGILKYANTDPLTYYSSGEKIADVLGLDGGVKGVIRAPTWGKVSALAPSLYVTCGSGIATYMPTN